MDPSGAPTAHRVGGFAGISRLPIDIWEHIVASWDEYMRQHDRLTRADSELENRLGPFMPQKPIVRHLEYL
jgi:hypothetical protein